MATYEEATHCPECSVAGEALVKKPSGRPGVMIHIIYCRNLRCPWFNTGWLVQVNEDGTIPDAFEQLGSKQYPKLSQESESKVLDALRAQTEAELRPNSEIRYRGF